MMIFSLRKYAWLAVVMVLLILSFFMMGGPANSSRNSFDEKVFSFSRITLSPLIILSVYLGMIFLILKNPKKCSDEKEKQPTTNN